MKMTDYCCPLCDKQLISIDGDCFGSENGMTLYCQNIACPAQEVSGHGKHLKDAYAVIIAKFTGKRNQEATVEE